MQCKVSHQLDYFPVYINSINLDRGAKSLGIQALSRALAFVKNIFATTCCMCTATFAHPQRSRDSHVCIHPVAFILNSFQAASLKPLHPLRQWLSCTYPSLRSHYSAHAAAPGAQEHQIDLWWGSDLRFETVAIIHATSCICRRLQLNKMPGNNVLCGVERQIKSLQRSGWVFQL